MRLSEIRSGRSYPCCQGCGASEAEGLCHGCAVDVMRVHNRQHKTACRCAACGTWTRASGRMGAAMTLATAKRVVS